MKCIDAAVAILVNVNREVLLQKKDLGYPWFPGGWCLFGGKIEKGERPELALHRELEEELGYPARGIRFFMEQKYHDSCAKEERQGVQYAFVVSFEGRIDDLRIREGAGFAFFALPELSSIPLVEHDRKIVEAYYASYPPASSI